MSGPDPDRELDPASGRTSDVPDPGADRGAAGSGDPVVAFAADEPAMWSRERVVTGWAQLWNIPNLLTLLRILLIPVFWLLLMHDDGQNTGTRLAATLIFMFAAFTDWLDGYLAR